MSGSPLRSTRNVPTSRERTELWQRVGRFVRQRRDELGLSQGDIIRVLGYKNRNAVSNIEFNKRLADSSGRCARILCGSAAEHWIAAEASPT